MVLKVTSVGNSIIYITGKKFFNNVTLTLFEGILLTHGFLTGLMHVLLDNTKQNLSVQNNQV